MAGSASPTIPSSLSHPPYRIDHIPPPDPLFTDAQNLLDSIEHWDRAKLYDGLATYSLKPKELQDKWHARISSHSTQDVSFEALWQIVGQDALEKESRFVPLLQKVTLLHSFSDDRTIWSIQFAAKTPFSPRIFNVFHISHLFNNVDGSRTGVSVCIPIDTSNLLHFDQLEESGVKGRLVVVESIKEIDSHISWRMAVCMDQGGLVPHFFTDKSIDSKMAAIVPRVLESLRSNVQVAEQLRSS